VFKNVVRGFSLVLQNLEVRNFPDGQDKSESKARAKLNSLNI
jgi:hypothetical protein